VIKIKKGLILLVFLVAVGLIILPSKSAMTKVQGECSNCHTMHASQSLTPDKWTARGFTGTPHGALVVGDCFGCHSDNGTDSTITVGGSTFPIVWNKAEPTAPLAAGNFYYVTTTGGGDTKGHNVSGIVGQDNTIKSYTPPGFKSISGWGPSTWDQQLTCAGTYGCHGLRNTTDQFAAIRGLHHASSGRPYRMLYGDASNGIDGKEDPNYEEGQLSGNPGGTHNVYKGSTDGADVTTISYLCGECHGKFHRNTNLGGTTEVGSQSPWLRHPTDIALAASGSSLFTTDYGTSVNYNYETPVAFANPAGKTTPVSTFSDGIVMCLSCHRAHASSKYSGVVPDDILRFDYTQIKAGTGVTTGCNRCHQRQR
jgi:hypothetical protein